MIGVCYGGPFNGALWDKPGPQFAVPVHVPGPMKGYYQADHSGNWQWRDGATGFTGPITNGSEPVASVGPAKGKRKR